MNPESLPDIPHPKNPEREWRKNAAETAVEAQVAELETGLDLRRHPEIRSRLAELGSHFEDSVAMARIIRSIYEPLKEALALTDGPERLMRAALVHDVGKSGPPGKETVFHHAVRRLFVPPPTSRPFNPFVDGRAKTVGEFVAERGMTKSAELLAELRAGGIDPDKESMIGFWRRHAAWTYGILKEDAGPDLDPGLADAAASHHLLEGENPAQLKLDKIPGEAQILEVLEAAVLAGVDKYQASRARGGLRHEQALDLIGRILDSRADLPPALIEKYRAVVKVLKQSEKILDQYFQPPESDQP